MAWRQVWIIVGIDVVVIVIVVVYIHVHIDVTRVLGWKSLPDRWWIIDHGRRNVIDPRIDNDLSAVGHCRTTAHRSSHQGRDEFFEVVK